MDATTDSNNAFHDNETTATAQQEQLLTCSFNQDGGCLAIGTTTGFSVHNLYPQYGISVQRQFPRQGGIGLIEMLFRCNLMVLVGGGPIPYSPPHRVLIHDDHQMKAIGELSFRQIVLNVKLRKDAIAVALRDRVYVYHLSDLSLRDKIYTADNEHGLLSVSTQINDMVLACPSVTTGHVRVELYGSRKTVLLESHESALHALALTADGSKLATASEKGTVIRVWDVHHSPSQSSNSSSCLYEFRRGVERATITCLSWSWDHAWLCCTSDKGTAHIFQVENNTDGDATKGNNEEKKSGDSTSASTSFTSMFLSTVRRSVEGDAKKSVCQIRGVPHPRACAFVAAAPNLVAIAGYDADSNGVLLLAEFQPGQEPKRVGYHVLCRSNQHQQDETEEARRRRRLRGWAPEIPQTPEGGRLYVGERVEILEKGMEQIRFDEGDDDDEFVSVSTVQQPPPSPAVDNNAGQQQNKKKLDEAEAEEEEGGVPENTDAGDTRSSNNNVADSIGDSMRTEPLDEEADSTGSAPSSS